MDDKTRTELEAASFRRLAQHLRERADVQNIDLMNLAGFCRNCLSKWYLAAANEKGVPMTDPEARETDYGMPYDEWKKKHQQEARKEAKSTLAQSHEPGSGQGAGQRGAGRGGRQLAVQHGVHPVPCELAQEPLKLPFHAREVRVVAEPALERGALDTRLPGVDFPRVEIEDEGTTVHRVHAAHRRAHQP